jgi:hypothetical protein
VPPRTGIRRQASGVRGKKEKKSEVIDFKGLFQGVSCAGEKERTAEENGFMNRDG